MQQVLLALGLARACLMPVLVLVMVPMPPPVLLSVLGLQLHLKLQGSPGEHIKTQKERPESTDSSLSECPTSVVSWRNPPQFLENCS